jgi:hypothetical protein
MRTYNSKKVIISCGYHMVTGYAEDSFVTIEEAGDGITSVSGADGEVSRSVSPDPRKTIKISLMQNSPSNAFFRKQYNKDKSDGSGTFAVLVKDLTDDTVFSADEAWVNKAPSWSRGKTVGNQEWEITAVGEFED